MSKMQLSSQLASGTRRYLSPTRNAVIFYGANCLALTVALAAVTNCSSTADDADTTSTDTAVAAILASVDKNGNNPAMVLEDSNHAFSWSPGSPGTYGGGAGTPASLSMYAVGDPNATVKLSTNQCILAGNGSWTSVSSTNDLKAACTAQAQKEATRLANAEGDAPTACFVGTGTVETANCGKQRVCTTTYGGGTSCSDVSVSMDMCHIKVTRAANTHYTIPFIPLGLDYEFPGSKTSLGYTNTTTQSVAWSITKSGGKSVKANILGEIFGIGGGGSYSFSTTDSGTKSVKVSAGGSRSGSDPFQNHNGDTFSLWINPAINYWTQCTDGDHAVYELSTDPTKLPTDPSKPSLIDATATALMQSLDQDIREVGVWSIDAGSLLHPESLTESRRANFVKSLSAAQIDQLLKMDPFYDSTNRTMRSSGDLSTGRFVDIPGSSLDHCPRNFSVPKGQSKTCNFDYFSSQVHIDGKSVSYNFSLGLKSPLGGVSFELTAGYSGTITTSYSSEVQANYTVVGPTSGQAAIDTLFGNYVLDVTP